MSDRSQPDPAAIMEYSYKRNLLEPRDRAIYEYSLKQGLTKPAAAPAGAGAATETDVMAPEASGTPAGAAVPDIANPLGAMGAAITRAPGELRRQQESFTTRAKVAHDADRLKQGYEPGVDYESGTGFGDRIQMKRMDNPAERRGMLEGRYGQDNVFEDKGSRLYVKTPDGKRTAPEGEGFITNLLASIYGQAPQVVGGTAGAILGGAGGGPAGAIGGAALGTAAGKAADEALKLLFGQQRKTLSEEVGALSQAAVEGAVGEGGGRMLAGTPGVLGRAFRKYGANVTPEGVDLAQSVAKAGGAAPARSLLPGLTSAAQTQDIATRLGSDFLEPRNRAAVQGRLRDIIEGAGKTPDQVRAELGEILDPASRVSATDAGKPIVGAVRQHATQLEGEAANLARDADQMLTAQLGRLNAMSRRSPAGALGEDVAGGMAQARTDFSTAMSKAYSQIDQITGNAPVVPTAMMQRRATEILAALPKDAKGEPIFGDPRVLRSLHQLADTPHLLPLGQAKAIRSTLGDFGEFTDLTPGVSKRQFDQLRQSADAAIGQAAGDPAVAPAIRLLRQADAAYAEGVRKFGDAEINHMVSQARTGIVPDPGKVASTVLVPGQSQRASTIKQMVGPDVWRRVAVADWENNILGRALDPQTGQVSAKRLAAAVQARDRGGMLDIAYGPQIAKEMRTYSQRLSTRGGNVPADSLAPDNFGMTMRQLDLAQRESDVFLKTNYLSELAKPGPRHDSAVNFVLKPGEETRLVEAQRFLGDTSSQMVGIRDQARKEILNSAVISTRSGETTTITGKGIEDALSKWTPRQQEIMFPGQVEDIKRLAKEVNFMFPVGNPEGLMGGMIAGGIKATPIPLRWGLSAPFIGWSWLLSQPGTMRVLSEGLRPGPGQAATRETVRMIFRAAAAGMLDDDAPPPQPIAEQITSARHAKPPSPQRDPDKPLHRGPAGP